MLSVMRRREFVGASLLLTTACAKPDFAVEDVEIASLSRALAEARVSSVDLVKTYLRRIESIDRKGPRLTSIIELNRDALSIAATLDRERAQKGVRSALHGVPILIKDNIDTCDKMMTTAGSLALENAPTPKQDAGVVTQLRRAGAVLLGKTNLSEWANLRSSRSTCRLEWTRWINAKPIRAGS